ncbi:beta propeller repeat protein [Micromonospora auratinigra]|uniref:Uncharacterized protein n=1 Tax=Micromonospora auratinigra TaxID=261654 RepID=A0A1A9A1A7_9ACTN|nr:hypothetical protein [Micromonospora auratinigra]SBT49867.1 hypothetical protein GA0070611_4574 [Micromonospora auratinigra]
MPDTAIEQLFAEFEATARETFRPPGVPAAQRRVRDRRRHRRGLLAGVAALLLAGSAGGYAAAHRGDRPTPTPTPTPTVSPSPELTERKVAVPGVPGRLADLRFVSGTSGWALFDTCEPFDAGARDCRRTVARTTDGGRSWRRTALPDVPTGVVQLMPVDHQHLTVATVDRFLVTEDGGFSWTTHPRTAPPDSIWLTVNAPDGPHLGCASPKEGAPPPATCDVLKIVLLDGIPLAHQPPVTLHPRDEAAFFPGLDGRYWLTLARNDQFTVFTSDYGGGPWRKLPSVPGAHRLTFSPDGVEAWLVRTERPNGVWRLVDDRWQPGPLLPDDTAEVAAVGAGLLVVTSTYGGAGFVTDGRHVDLPVLRDALRGQPDDTASVATLPDGTVQILYGETQILGIGQGVDRQWIRYS